MPVSSQRCPRAWSLRRAPTCEPGVAVCAALSLKLSPTRHGRSRTNHTRLVAANRCAREILRCRPAAATLDGMLSIRGLAKSYAGPRRRAVFRDVDLDL